MTKLNSKGDNLQRHLHALRQHKDESSEQSDDNELVNVVGAGGAFTAAYEQIRNAAENSEEHLLLQNAIKRFLKRIFLLRDITLISQAGSELAIELTLAGYIDNNSLTKKQVKVISQKALEYYSGLEQIISSRGVPSDKASKWVVDILAVEISWVIDSKDMDRLFVDFAYTELSESIKEEALFGQKVNNFGGALFIAIYRSLMKADNAVVREALASRYQIKIKDIDQFVDFNQNIDQLIASDTTSKLIHAVDRQGATLRILRQMMIEKANFDELLPKREVFLDEFEKQVQIEYDRVGKKLNRAIVRSLVFLVITKVLIGVAIEVPYDYLVHGAIIWLPLVVNLLFPPLYMLALRAAHAMPGSANTRALIDRVDTMFYGEKLVLERSAVAGKRYSKVFSIVYSLSSLAVFVLLIYGLLLLQFTVVHIAIFFVFLSAASFLGFRLSRLIRELEVVRSAQNGLTFVRDLIYLPFVVVGRWMSEKYAQVNIVAIILDMLIELPMKTILRFVRQWGAFIDDRKDKL